MDRFGNGWIVSQAASGLLLEHEVGIRKLEAVYKKNVHSYDKMVASFHFSFWTYLFTKRNYRVGGKTLLEIFSAKAHG